MALRDGFWYEIGKGTSQLAAGLARANGEESPEHSSSADDPGGDRPSGRDATELIIMSGLSAAALSGLRRWAAGRRPGFRSLVRGAIAGAGAAACLHVVRVLRRSESEEQADRRPTDVLDGLMSGAGRGLIYAAVLDPLLPGPPLVRGVLAGTAEYLAAPLGGLFSHLEALSPIRRVPFISVLLETGHADEDDRFLSFLAYGVILGALYGNAGSGSAGS